MNVEKKKSPECWGHSQAFSLSDCLVQSASVSANCTTSNFISQEKYISEFYNEITDKFTPKKENSILLSESYKRLGLFSKANRVSECGSFLSFAGSVDTDNHLIDKLKLHSANFCKDRLCPMCIWRRSYKLLGQVSNILNYLGDNYKYLMLTLTVPNCTADCLNNTISDLMRGYHRLIDYKVVKSVVLGSYKALEITYNSISDTFHPHLHCLLAVPKSYGKHFYISQSEWLSLWRKAMKNNDIKIVDVRIAKDKNSSDSECGSIKSAVLEIVKYTVKDKEYLNNDYLVRVLSSALYHRRLISFTGVFKDAFQQLNCVDIFDDDIDLVHINDEDKLNSVAQLLVRLRWFNGSYQIFSSAISYTQNADG